MQNAWWMKRKLPGRCARCGMKTPGNHCVECIKTFRARKKREEEERKQSERRFV